MLTYVTVAKAGHSSAVTHPKEMLELQRMLI